MPFLQLVKMNNSLSYNNLKKTFDLLGPKPTNIEVWVRDYIPGGHAFKIILKDLPSPVAGYLPDADEIYMIGTEDFSMEMSEILRNVNIPVFAPGGKRL